MSIGTCPKDISGFEQRPDSGKPYHDIARHGIVVYDRRLTDAETKSFELALLTQDPDLDHIAIRTADQMKNYAAQYLRQAEQGKPQYTDKCLEFAKSTAKGYPEAIADTSDFCELVAQHLKEYL
jgi:hypothetical protein